MTAKEVAERAVALYQQGESIRAVARALELSPRIVRRMLEGAQTPLICRALRVVGVKTLHQRHVVEGASITSIAKEFQITRATVMHGLLEAGIEPEPDQSGRSSPEERDLREEAVRAGILAGKSFAAIGEELSLSRQRVWRIHRRGRACRPAFWSGVPMPTRARKKARAGQ